MSKEKKRRRDIVRTRRVAMLGKGAVILIGTLALVGWAVAIIS